MPNHYCNNEYKVMSIVALVTAAIFALSSIVVKPVVAESYGGGGGGNDSGSDSENYRVSEMSF